MRFLIVLLSFLFMTASVPAFAGVDGADVPSVGGKGIIAEPGVGIAAGKSFVGIPVFFEADDTAAYEGPTGATALDAGDEACAVFGLSCAVVYKFIPNAATDMDVVVNGCTDDAALTDNDLAFAICY